MALLKYPGYSAIRQKDASFTEINPSQTCLDDSTISISAAAEQSNVKPSILTKDNDAICGKNKRSLGIFLIVLRI